MNRFYYISNLNFAMYGMVRMKALDDFFQMWCAQPEHMNFSDIENILHSASFPHNQERIQFATTGNQPPNNQCSTKNWLYFKHYLEEVSTPIWTVISPSGGRKLGKFQKLSHILIHASNKSEFSIQKLEKLQLNVVKKILHLLLIWKESIEYTVLGFKAIE